MWGSGIAMLHHACADLWMVWTCIVVHECLYCLQNNGLCKRLLIGCQFKMKMNRMTDFKPVLDINLSSRVIPLKLIVH